LTKRCNDTDQGWTTRWTACRRTGYPEPVSSAANAPPTNTNTAPRAQLTRMPRFDRLSTGVLRPTRHHLVERVGMLHHQVDALMRATQAGGGELAAGGARAGRHGGDVRRQPYPRPAAPEPEPELGLELDARFEQVQRELARAQATYDRDRRGMGSGSGSGGFGSARQQQARGTRAARQQQQQARSRPNTAEERRQMQIDRRVAARMQYGGGR
jgi:hypothetical protein